MSTEVLTRHFNSRDEIAQAVADLPRLKVMVRYYVRGELQTIAVEDVSKLPAGTTGWMFEYTQHPVGSFARYGHLYLGDYNC